jgi:predicted outer membrane protein
MQTANHWGIEQAHQALSMGKSPRVKKFALSILADASAADVSLSRFDERNGITPRTSPVAERVRIDWEHNLSNLSSARGTDFDRLYVGAQVAEYTEVLSILDDTLLPHVQDADLMTALRGMRAKIAAHLKMAQDIVAALPGSQ